MRRAQFVLLILINSCFWSLETLSSHPFGTVDAQSAIRGFANNNDPFFLSDNSPRGQTSLNESSSGSAAAASATQATQPPPSDLPACAVSGAAEQPQPFVFNPQSHQQLVLALAAANASLAALHTPPPTTVAQLPANAMESQFSGLPLPVLPTLTANANRPHPAHRTSVNRHPQDRFQQLSPTLVDRPQPARRTSANSSPQDRFQPPSPALVAVAAAAPPPDIKKAAEQTPTMPPLSLTAQTHSPNLTVASALTAANTADRPAPAPRIAASPSTPVAEPSYAPIRRERRVKKKVEGETTESPAEKLRKKRQIQVTCSYCNKTMQKDSLDNHLKRHKKKYNFACTLCDFEGLDLSIVARHFFSAHKGNDCKTCKALQMHTNIINPLNAGLRAHLREEHAQKIQFASRSQKPRKESAESSSPPPLTDLLTAAAASSAHASAAQTPASPPATKQPSPIERSDSPELSPKTTKKIYDEVIKSSDMTDDGK